MKDSTGVEAKHGLAHASLILNVTGNAGNGRKLSMEIVEGVSLPALASLKQLTKLETIINVTP
jgi:hypothetical protein